MFNRIAKPSLTHSFFLIGPRGTGKSTLLHERLRTENAHFIGLRAPDIEDLVHRDPKGLERQLTALHADVQWIVIEEIHKVPELLDIVPRLLESTNRRFIMCGTKARKISRQSSGIAEGNPRVYKLHPLTFLELGDIFQLPDALQWGTLPQVFHLGSREEKVAYLRAYVGAYFQEDIVAEKTLLRVDCFRNFLREAAKCNGEIVNCTAISRVIGVGIKSVQAYYSFLEETLVGYSLPGYHFLRQQSQKRHPKFYLFDLGFKRALEGTLEQDLVPNTEAFEQAFKHLVIVELFRWASYFAADWRFSYVHIGLGRDIELSVERPGRPLALVLIKSKDSIGPEDLSIFRHLPTSLPASEYYCFSLDPQPKKIGNVICLPWREGIQRLAAADAQPGTGT
jgi:predicted AAA+ superfamily ATPase